MAGARRSAAESLVARTAVGRTTIVVLAMNHPDAVAVRRSLIAEGLFPIGR
jgi:hypothetical protein